MRYMRSVSVFTEMEDSFRLEGSNLLSLYLGVKLSRMNGNSTVLDSPCAVRALWSAKPAGGRSAQTLEGKK